MSQCSLSSDILFDAASELSGVAATERESGKVSSSSSSSALSNEIGLTASYSSSVFVPRLVSAAF